jgi:RNA polymerase-binding protein DksA
METDLRSMLTDALLLRKQELESALHQSRSFWRDWTQGSGEEDPADELDDALHETSIHNHYSLVEKKTRELRKINELLRRMERDEEFGLCEECGEPIPVERLMILPDATHCVPCQCGLERRDGLRLSGAWGAHYVSERRARDWENPDDEETALFDAHIEAVDPPDSERFRNGSPFEGEILEG